MTRKALWLIFLSALLFFNKSRGCDCEMLVYNNANAQIDSWNAALIWSSNTR